MATTNDSNSAMPAFDPAEYEHARTLLAEKRREATTAVGKEAARRKRIVAIAAVVWLACTVGLALAGPDLILVAEIGWIVIVAFGVFFLLPAVMGKSNVTEMFDDYEKALDALEGQQAPLPHFATIEEFTSYIGYLYPAVGDSPE